MTNVLPQLAKTEIIYRTKMTQMKGKEQDITKIMKAKEDKNVEVELAYKNEKMLRNGLGPKNAKRLASEIKMLESELKEYQDIKAAMIANTNGKTVDQLKRNNDKLKAQAATALKNKRKTGTKKSRAVG